FQDDVAMVGGQFDFGHDYYSFNEFVGFGAFKPSTGPANVGQGAQFSVPGANFEAVFHLHPIKCSRFRACSVSDLTASA
ncbi:hypothetical protein C1X25_38505, partial [Pseudomonas sp. GW247-3R2A]